MNLTVPQYLRLKRVAKGLKKIDGRAGVHSAAMLVYERGEERFLRTEIAQPSQLSEEDALEMGLTIVEGPKKSKADAERWEHASHWASIAPPFNVPDHLRCQHS